MQLSGAIPVEMFTANFLVYMYRPKKLRKLTLRRALYRNNLTGTIHNEFTTSNAGFLLAHHNLISGTLPTFPTNLRELYTFTFIHELTVRLRQLEYNSLEGSLPLHSSLRELTKVYVG